jgi:hypothetical protein
MESLRAQRMYVYDELEAMGLGLNRLRILRDTIGEIAAENSINSTMAVQEFFKSLEQQYDTLSELKYDTQNQQLRLDPTTESFRVRGRKNTLRTRKVIKSSFIGDPKEGDMFIDLL